MGKVNHAISLTQQVSIKKAHNELWAFNLFRL
jgi:hypothetical protein